MDVQNNAAEKQRVKGTLFAILVVAIAFLLYRNNKYDGQESRAHIPIEQLAGTSGRDVLHLLNFHPRTGVSLQDTILIGNLTTYIGEHIQDTYKTSTEKEIQQVAFQKAKSLVLASIITGVPLRRGAAKAHGESHFGSRGVGMGRGIGNKRGTNNPLNLGNTDSGLEKTFSDEQLGVLCAFMNIAGRMYEYVLMFPERNDIDFYAIHMNRDPQTGIGFLRHQENYGIQNPLRNEGKKSPYGAYATNPHAVEKAQELGERLHFISPKYDEVEIIRHREESTFYYEKSVLDDEQTYHVFSYIAGSGEMVGEIRSVLAQKIGIKQNEITILPYDTVRGGNTQEDRIVIPSGTLVFILYIETPTQ